jgi:hypothetical protein
MSGVLGGGSNITTEEPRLGSMRVQQSSQGVPIAMVWGRNRVSPNLLWFDDFQAIEQRTSQQTGGKGGGTTVTNVNYTYRASYIAGLCAGLQNGGVVGVQTVWRDKQKITGITRTLPGSEISLATVVPVGKVVNVGDARWGNDVQVYYRFPSGSEDGSYSATPIYDYSATAGVYTFGATVSVGWDILITYHQSDLTETLSALQAAGFSAFFGGAVGQAVWGYLASAHPAQALGYSAVAYVAAASFLLGGAAGLPQLAFEVDGPAQVGGGNVDANPADIATDLLTDPLYGGGFPASQLDPLTTYRSWCAAAGLWLSPVWSERKGVFEYINQLAKLTHSRPLWSVDTLKLIPMATEALVTGTGSFTPLPEHSAAVYVFTDDDFADPIEEQRSAPADRFNRVSINYRGRAIDYADAVESAEDKASIDAFGLIESPEVINAYEVASAAVAAVVCELLLREYMVQGSEYRFTVPVNYDLLEPLDLVQIEDARIDLAPRVVRVIEISESGDDGTLDITAEDVRTTGAVTQARQAGGGFVYPVGPPNAVFVRAVMMPTAATGNVQQLWLGVSADENWGGSTVWVSSTGIDYRRLAEINTRARLGALGANIASASVSLNPAQILTVDLDGQTELAGVTQVDADAYRSLLWVDGELMSFRDATLVAAAEYELTYLQRQLYGTASPGHVTGDPWMRMDDAVLKMTVAPADLGSTLYIKVTSRNALGTYTQGLDEVTALPVLLAPQLSVPGEVAALALTSAFIGTYFEVNWLAASRAVDYEVEVRDMGGTLMRSSITSAVVFRYLYSDALADGDAKRNYTVKVRARNAAGNGVWASLAISNPAPAATTGVAAAGSGTSRTMSWTASAATDFAGYLARYSTTTGFDPAAGAGTAFYDGTAATAPLTGLTVGVTYYVRVAAYDVWDKDIADLTWSAQYSFTA